MVGSGNGEMKAVAELKATVPVTSAKATVVVSISASSTKNIITTILTNYSHRTQNLRAGFKSQGLDSTRIGP